MDLDVNMAQEVSQPNSQSLPQQCAQEQAQRNYGAHPFNHHNASFGLYGPAGGSIMMPHPYTVQPPVPISSSPARYYAANQYAGFEYGPGWGNQPASPHPYIPLAANPVGPQRASPGPVSDPDSDMDKISRIPMPALTAPRAVYQEEKLLRNMRRKSLDFDDQLIPNTDEYKHLKRQYRAMIQHPPPRGHDQDNTVPRDDASKKEYVRQLYEAALDFDRVDSMPKKKKNPMEPLDPNHPSFEVRQKLQLFSVEMSGIELQIKC